MSLSHHISDDFLVGYASGSLAEGWSLAVATHLAFCDQCRARVAEASALGGALLDDMAPAPVGPGALQSVLTRIGEVAVEAPPKPAPPRPPTVIPEPLLGYVGADADALRWQKIGSAGFQLLIRTGDRATSVRLLRIKAGAPVPEHGHRGQELTVVLAGTLVDGDIRFGRGEVEEADESVQHQPRAGAEAECLCLAVTDAPLRFKNLIVRLAQPFLKI